MNKLTLFSVVLNSLITLYLCVKNLQHEKSFKITIEIIREQINCLISHEEKLQELEKNSQNTK